MTSGAMGRIFVVALCLIVFSFEAFAQRDPNQLLYAQKVEKYTRMKYTGAKLTVAGGILFVVGISMVVDAANSTSRASAGTVQSQANSGLLVYGIGYASMAAGIPLWVVGGHAKKKYERKFERLSLGMNLSPNNTGLSLAFRF